MATVGTPFLLLLVALGGAAGAVCRALVASVADGASFPVGTVVVNIAGSFLIGLFWGVAGQMEPLSEGRRQMAASLVVSGFLGGFTTFSSYSMQTLRLLLDDRLGAALGNVLLQNAAGLAAAALGYAAGRALVRLF